MATLVLGTSGQDTLRANEGSADTLIGGAGNDTYGLNPITTSPRPTLPPSSMVWLELGSGFGVDALEPLSNFAPDPVYGVRFTDPAHTADACYFELRNSGDPQDPAGESQWVMRFTGSPDMLVLPADPRKYQSNPYSTVDTLQYISVSMPTVVEFGDGTVWSADEVQARAVQAEQTGLVVYGSTGNDVLTASATHAQAVVAGAGNDTLVAGAFNSRLEGGAGADTYVLTTGWGTERDGYIEADTVKLTTGLTLATPRYRLLPGTSLLTVVDPSASDATDSVLRFADDTRIESLTFGLDPSRSRDLTITRTDTGQALLISGFATIDAALNVTDQNLARIEFANGQSISGADIVRAVFTRPATDGADTLVGQSATDDLVRGLGGNDLLQGLGGTIVCTVTRVTTPWTVAWAPTCWMAVTATTFWIPQSAARTP